MPCLSLPKLPLPDLGPISFTPPKIPLPSLNANLCCKLIAFDPPPIPIPLPPGVINPAFVQALRAYGKLVQAALDKIAIKCPRESPDSPLIGG